MYEEITIEELVKLQPKELRKYTISDADYTDYHLLLHLPPVRRVYCVWRLAESVRI